MTYDPERFPEHLQGFGALSSGTIYRLNRAYWIKALGGCCVDCGTGRKNPVVLTFDYKDRTAKRVLTSMLSRTDQTQLAEEVQLVDLRCLNCQAIRGTHKRNHRISAKHPAKHLKKRRQRFDHPAKQSVMDI